MARQKRGLLRVQHKIKPVCLSCQEIGPNDTLNNGVFCSPNNRRIQLSKRSHHHESEVHQITFEISFDSPYVFICNISQCGVELRHVTAQSGNMCKLRSIGNFKRAKEIFLSQFGRFRESIQLSRQYLPKSRVFNRFVGLLRRAQTKLNQNKTICIKPKTIFVCNVEKPNNSYRTTQV